MTIEYYILDGEIYDGRKSEYPQITFFAIGTSHFTAKGITYCIDFNSNSVLKFYSYILAQQIGRFYETVGRFYRIRESYFIKIEKPEIYL